MNWVIRRPDGYMLQEVVHFPVVGTRWTLDITKARKSDDRALMERERAKLSGTDDVMRPVFCPDCMRSEVVDVG